MIIDPIPQEPTGAAAVASADPMVFQYKLYVPFELPTHTPTGPRTCD